MFHSMVLPRPTNNNLLRGYFFFFFFDCQKAKYCSKIEQKQFQIRVKGIDLATRSGFDMKWFSIVAIKAAINTRTGPVVG